MVTNTSNNAKNPTVVIGIDHGYGNIKTANICFRAGVTAYEKEPIFTADALFYNGTYYGIGEDHKEFIPDKMTDQTVPSRNTAHTAEQSSQPSTITLPGRTEWRSSRNGKQRY